MTSIIIELLKKIGASLVGTAASKAAGYTNYAVAVGAIAWLFGPGREWTIKLNALEVSAVALIGALIVEWARRMRPPGGQ